MIVCHTIVVYVKPWYPWSRYLTAEMGFHLRNCDG
jgi:hypothetical protein